MATLKEGNEKRPPDATRVAIDYIPPDSIEHLVSDAENWQTLAARYGHPALDIIRSNFNTTDPAEINWYLREYVNCDVTTPDRYNWRFSASARNGPSPRAGKIFIVPRWPLILHAAKVGTQQAVTGWFSLARFSGQISGGNLSGFHGCLTGGLLAHRLLFVDHLRRGGASDKLAEGWADFLEQILSDFAKGVTVNEPQAYPFYANWNFPSMPPPMMATQFPMLSNHQGSAIVKRSHLLTILRLHCGSLQKSIGGNDMARSYAAWFERSFEVFCQSAMARGVFGFPGPKLPGMALQGSAVGGPGFLVTQAMPL